MLTHLSQFQYQIDKTKITEYGFISQVERIVSNFRKTILNCPNDEINLLYTVSYNENVEIQSSETPKA